jgi:hypothetical protein
LGKGVREYGGSVVKNQQEREREAHNIGLQANAHIKQRKHKNARPKVQNEYSHKGKGGGWHEEGRNPTLSFSVSPLFSLQLSYSGTVGLVVMIGIQFISQQKGKDKASDDTTQKKDVKPPLKEAVVVVDEKPTPQVFFLNVCQGASSPIHRFVGSPFFFLVCVSC